MSVLGGLRIARSQIKLATQGTQNNLLAAIDKND